MNIIVNGGTKGIGRETIACLAQQKNIEILATGRDSNRLKELSESYSNVRSLSMDISKPAVYAGDLLKLLSSEFKTIDIMINMAGLLIPEPFMKISDNDARAIFETNFFGPASLIRIIKPFMPAGSHIINISSMGGFQGSSKYKGLAYYSASKAAIACLTECLAEEFKDDDIRVNCLALGSVQTEMLSAAFPGYNAPVSAKEMGEFIAGFSLQGHKIFNGKILPVAVTNP